MFLLFVSNCIDNTCNFVEPMAQQSAIVRFATKQEVWQLLLAMMITGKQTYVFCQLLPVKLCYNVSMSEYDAVQFSVLLLLIIVILLLSPGMELHSFEMITSRTVRTCSPGQGLRSAGLSRTLDRWCGHRM